MTVSYTHLFLQLQTTEDKIRMATKSLKQDYQNTKTLTAKAKTEKEKLDQAAAKKKSKLASYQKQLASDKELLAWFEAEEKRQEEMDLASAKDGNADNTTSKAQSEKNMTGSTASKNTTSKATTESKKETTTTPSPSTTVSSGNLSSVSYTHLIGNCLRSYIITYHAFTVCMSWIAGSIIFRLSFAFYCQMQIYSVPVSYTHLFHLQALDG